MNINPQDEMMEEEAVDLFEASPQGSDVSETEEEVRTEVIPESKRKQKVKPAVSLKERLLEMASANENDRKKRKRGYTWFFSVVGECLLVIPVIIMLIFLSQFFH